ncbi:uncharacterized protein LOC129948393 [Eupeodes corollae]|uniref:uncharacterized protein LOC129948393 n=1 Tax=Eupeodes corollae TaxID=290404 RepID=UPI002492D724|nr:uncharacterized protein LOC129948393 [Eupeodes corollae]
MDFKNLYPKAESLLLKYDDFPVKIVPIFEDEIKDPTSRQTLSEMMNNEKTVPENGRACGIFYLIHSLLIPTAKLITGSGSQKAITRFSIRDSQASFLLVGSTVAACDEERRRFSGDKKKHSTTGHCYWNNFGS